MARLILDQPRKQACNRIMLDKQVIGRKHLPLFRVEQEHQPHQHREQSFVDLMCSVGPIAQAPENLASRFLIGRLEPFQQFEQGRQHLLGELRRDLVLILATLGQDVVQPLAARAAGAFDRD